MPISSSLVSTFINVMIIVFVAKAVRKAVKKRQAQANNETKTKNNMPTAPKPIQAPKAYVKQVINTNKITERDKLNLKRCPNCGGEIPISMMKCDICGARQPGVWVPFVLALILAAGIVFALLSQDDGSAVREFFGQISNWLAKL